MKKFILTALSTLMVSMTASAATSSELNVANLPVPGTVTETDGLSAWNRIYSVVSHPRCVNCHVGAENVPVWSGPNYGKRRRHGMAVVAGTSRIGTELMSCRTCHQTSKKIQTIPHAAPQAGVDWQLAPVEFQWIDKSSQQICQQLRDPKKNGGRNAAGLIEHIIEDVELVAFISWSFNPGAGRQPPPGSLQRHLEDMAVWAAAGMPCPSN